MMLEVAGKATYAYTGSREPVSGQPTLVFIHGAGLDHTVWTMQARYFAHHHCNVFVPDLPGHGRSDGELLSSVPDIADWIGTFIEATAAGPVLLAGHSMGSLVSLECAARHPGAINALALVGTAVPMGVAPLLQDAADANESAAYDMITIWGHSLPAQVGGGPHSPGMWLTGASQRLLERGGDGVLGNDLRTCSAYTTGAESAARVSCPSLLVLGGLDMMTPPRAARGVTDALQDSRTVLVKASGHMLMAEQSDAVLDALIAFNAHRLSCAA
jgi:pimeloyl-ACP methyl ester carboxylesterase